MTEFKASGHERGYVQGTTHARPSTEDPALATPSARIAIKRSHTHQCTDFTSREAAKLWDFRNQGRSGGRADAFHATEQGGESCVVR